MLALLISVRFLALFGPHAMSDLSPECAPDGRIHRWIFGFMPWFLTLAFSVPICAAARDLPVVPIGRNPPH
jgi:hypothetical protein